MSHGYKAVQWSRKKAIYDLILWSGVLVYILVFMLISSAVNQGPSALSPMILLIRAFASCAFLMLSIILCIGPLARLNSRFLPLLYNRRHLGVSMFVVVLVHALLSLFWYHSFGVENPLVSLISAPGDWGSLSEFPFQQVGALALVVLLLLAATSHDFWNTILGAPLWKAIHMAVYLAYALVVVHVATGAVQQPQTGFAEALLFASLLTVGGLHLAAALKSRSVDLQAENADWVNLGDWRDIPNNRAIVVEVGKAEPVAIFRYQTSRIAAVANACQHQNGPLGEGRVIDGYITCPWHGFQYQPEDGCSPAPFTEKISTYELRLEGEQLWLNPNPLAPGSARPVLNVDTVIDAVTEESSALQDQEQEQADSSGIEEEGVSND